MLNNCYQATSQLFVRGGGEIASQKATVQGNPLGMAMFALSILSLVPLMVKLSEVCESLIQVWFIDDVSKAGSFHRLRQCWDALSTLSPAYGYHHKPALS